MAISISIGHTQFTGNFDSSIRHHVNVYQAHQNIKDARGWDDATFANVDWHNFGQHFFKALPITARIQRTKLIHQWQPVGTQRLRDATIKDPLLALCPTCQDTIDTPDHLFLCDQRQSLRHRHYQPITKITHRKPHHPALVILSNGIYQWLSSELITIQDQVTSLPIFLQETVSAAIYEQFDIGWNNAIHGILSQLQVGCSGVNSSHYRALRERHW
jgi:hypothetical protein